jgi:hypothetical protein
VRLPRSPLRRDLSYLLLPLPRPTARLGPWCLRHGLVRPVRGVWRGPVRRGLLRESGGARVKGMRDGAVPGVDPGTDGRAGRHALAGLCPRRRVGVRIEE